MKKILVPIDFSENAKRALSYAVQFAVTADASLTVYHICVNKLNLKDQRELEKELSNFCNNTLEKHDSDMDLISSNVINGESIKAINEVDIISTIDLVVMGTKGASDVNTDLVGSNTINLINSCSKPILVIPPHADYIKASNIMFCSDYKELEIDYSLPILKEFVTLMESNLRIVHIKTNDNAPHPVHIEESRREGKFFEPEVKPAYKLVHAKNVFDGINYYTNLKGDNEILAMVNRHHSFFNRLFRTNTTEKLAYHTDVPLLVLPE